MLDKRYVITNGNRLAIPNDLLQSLSALNQPWPQRMRESAPANFLPHRGVALLTNFYQAHDYLLHGDDKIIWDRASELLGEIVSIIPLGIYLREAEKH